MGIENFKPLHVQVAEAIGVLPVRCRKGFVQYDQWCIPVTDVTEGQIRGGYVVHIHGDKYRREPYEPLFIGCPNYDTDWSATGPLVEKYGIMLVYIDNKWEARFGYKVVPSFCDDRDGGPEWDESAPGETARVAVCHLILLLHQTGKLKEVI